MNKELIFVVIIDHIEVYEFIQEKVLMPSEIVGHKLWDIIDCVEGTVITGYFWV